MSDILIGGAKRARRAYSFDEIAIAPSRRTRDQSEVSTAWNIDAYRFDLPFIAAPMRKSQHGSEITIFFFVTRTWPMIARWEITSSCQTMAHWLATLKSAIMPSFPD